MTPDTPYRMDDIVTPAQKSKAAESNPSGETPTNKPQSGPIVRAPRAERGTVEFIGDYCEAQLIGTTGKTDVWSIEGETDRLGVVKWFGRWRGYAFFPKTGTVFEQKCLRAVADFCERITKDHREAGRVAK